MKRNLVPSAACAAALLWSCAALAQGYLGIAAGPTHVNADCTGLSSCDNRGNGGKVFGGYRFGPNWGAEVGYLDFGKGNYTLGTAASDLRTTAFAAGLSVMGDFSPSWMGAARLGVARVKGEVSVAIGGLKASETSTQPYVGLSLGYKLSKDLSLDGAIDYSKVKFGDSGAVRLISIGLTYHF